LNITHLSYPEFDEAFLLAGLHAVSQAIPSLSQIPTLVVPHLAS
jgi:hypothetical protein